MSNFKLGSTLELALWMRNENDHPSFKTNSKVLKLLGLKSK